MNPVTMWDPTGMKMEGGSSGGCGTLGRAECEQVRKEIAQQSSGCPNCGGSNDEGGLLNDSPRPPIPDPMMREKALSQMSFVDTSASWQSVLGGNNAADSGHEDNDPCDAPLGCAGPFVGDAFFFAAWGMTQDLLVHGYIECLKWGDRACARALEAAEITTFAIGACYLGHRLDLLCRDDDDDDDDDRRYAYPAA